MKQLAVKTTAQRRQESPNLLSFIDFPVHRTQTFIPEEAAFELRSAYEIAKYIGTVTSRYCVWNDPELRGELIRPLEHTALWRTVLAGQGTLMLCGYIVIPGKLITRIACFLFMMNTIKLNTKMYIYKLS